MRPHQGPGMRITIDLPEDLHRIATSLALHTQRSLSATVCELMCRGLQTRVAEREAPAYLVDDQTGLPVVQSTRMITQEDVKALEDDA